MSRERELRGLAAWPFALPAAFLALFVLGAVQQTEREVAAEAHRQYCASVATWHAEARQGIAPEHRTGHPDYDGIAAEQCPNSSGTLNSSRQLASY
ncbi:hypothetical protein QWY79_10390 [Halomonas sabkhae]|uniref:hypothetical protein n=1 Tax=Halomonas sabkhae TaxID=626223 RepID=UPI0025B5108E|nr:hypothetical protein [Halomonas sabkhae]MDN3525671.1 hypothetical protein [Halomonas sabkhae]